MIYLILVLVIVLFIIFLRTVLFRSSLDRSVPPKEYDGTPGRAAEILSKAVGCRSVSYGEYEKFDYPEFTRFLELIRESYPLFNRTCYSEILNDYSIVYCLKGRNSSLKPLLLLGHYDVVPVEKGAADSWSHEPFSGEISQGFLWGRGTLDMKFQIIAHLEAAERLLEQEWQPERDIWFSYNFDEEQGGIRGASCAVAYFEKKGISFDMVFDEGGAIVQGVISGVKPPMAIIGLGEKGISNIKIQVRGAGGHSSTPPSHTAIGKLGKIIADLEANPMPARLTAPVKAMLSVIGPEMPGVTRMALANMFLFKPLVLKIFARGATTNAMIRTSLSATMIQGGDAPNVLPLQAEAIINARLLPGDSGEAVLNHIRKTALKSCQEEDFTIEPLLLREASVISSHLTEQYKKISRGINEIYPEVLISPYLMMGGSDSSKFSRLSDNIYRFMPILITKEELSTIHNRDERISLVNIERATSFFEHFIRQYN